MKSKKLSMTILAFLASIVMLPLGLQAQESRSERFSDLESIADENYDYMKKIQRIIRDYPNFSYTYNLQDGEIQSVNVTGVENELDKKRLEVVIFDLETNRNKMKNQANRIGVFYSVDENAEYAEGRDALETKILSNLKYPEEAKNWGVEGTIYLKFVVDAQGEIPFATVSEDINTSFPFYVKDLEQQAISALKTTSGHWEPGEVEDVAVPTLVVLPVTFDFQKDPAIRALVR